MRGKKAKAGHRRKRPVDHGALVNNNVRISICPDCGRRGLVSNDTHKCACFHENDIGRRCRIKVCKERVEAGHGSEGRK